jgi:MFS family permease
MLALLAGAQLLGMSLWFTASAVSPQLAELWALSPSRTGWLTTSVQIGFVAGTALAATLNLADILRERIYFVSAVLLGAAANAALLIAPGYEVALLLRFLTGFCLAGVYPPAMKMVATWFRTNRGLAIGVLVGALTVGKAMPFLVNAFADADMVLVLATTSMGAVVSGILVLVGYRPGPFPFDRRPFSWGLVGTVLGHRPTRLAIFGYLGHMWELYAAWAAWGAFFLAFFTLRGTPDPVLAAGLSTFAAIAAGGFGSVVAGVWADRWGRERVASLVMAASGTCALLVGWLVQAPALVVVPLVIVWGATIVADSAQFSALVTEVAPPHAVGTALTLQTSMGFALTGISIWLTFEVATRWGWGPAFALLAVGPVFGIASMMRLRRLPSRDAAAAHRARRAP